MLAPAVDVGTIVRVPLHGRRVRGWVVALDVEPEAGAGALASVAAVVSAGPPAPVVELCRWAAWRWAGPFVRFLRAASAPNTVHGAPPELAVGVYPEPAVEAQIATLVGVAWQSRRSALEWPPAIPAEHLLLALVEREGSTIVLDPSGTRASRLAAALEAHGREVVALRVEHGDAARTVAWGRARAGACVVIGGRSAVWAPVPDLTGMVVVDEADEALEEERAPTWNARDVAAERAARGGARFTVVSPAPTVDAVHLVGPVVAAPSARRCARAGRVSRSSTRATSRAASDW